MIPPWTVTQDGYPTLVDGSLARWLRQRDAARAAHTGQREGAEQRRRRTSEALAATAAAGAGAAVATGPAAPIVLAVSGLVGVVALALRGLPGGLVSTNDLDRDGRGDDQTAPGPAWHVQRVAEGLQLRSLYPGGPLAGPTGRRLPLSELLPRLAEVSGVDLTVYWLLQLLLEPERRERYPNPWYGRDTRAAEWIYAPLRAVWAAETTGASGGRRTRS